MINFCIIHFNTPKLTECLVRSINKHTPNSIIYIFDNSDKLPFTYRTENVKYIDNTKGQIINFDKWLLKYPKRTNSPGKLNKWGSAKHCYSVEKCIEIINENFILLDSDILLTNDVSSLWDESKIYVGEVVTQPKSSIKRVLPYICFLNVKMMKEKDVHYFDEKYMHGIRYTIGGDMYDTGAGFYLAASKYHSKQIKTDDYAVHYSGGSWIKEKELKYKHDYTPEQWLVRYRKLWDTMSKRKNVVYTCITGGYDSLLTNIKISDNFDYVCFTDDMSLDTGGIWELRPMPSEVANYSKVKQQRYIKICAHKVLPEYDNCLWIDANVTIRGDIDDFITRKCPSDKTVFIPAHPSRTCIYKEGMVCKQMKKDTAQNIDAQMERYRKEGFPENSGLVQTNIMFRKHKDPFCIKLMEIWWEELSKGSCRDQLSFNYALWKTDGSGFYYLDKATCNSTYFLWAKTHRKYTPSVKASTTVVQEKKSTETKSATNKDFIFDDLLVSGKEIKAPVKYKPQVVKFTGNRHPRTKSMKAILML